MNKIFIPGYTSTFFLQEDFKEVWKKSSSLTTSKTLAILEGARNGNLWPRLSKGLYSVVGKLDQISRLATRQGNCCATMATASSAVWAGTRLDLQL